MLAGIVTLVVLVQPSNVPDAILVTGRALIVLGRVMAPPGPVYLVMVIAPLFVVQVKGVRSVTATGGSVRTPPLAAFSR